MDEYEAIGYGIDMMFEDSISGYVTDEAQEEIWLTEEEEEEALRVFHQGW